MSAAPTRTIRRRLPREVAAVAIRQGEYFLTIVDAELHEPAARWAGALAIARRAESRGDAYGAVMRKEIPAVA